MLGVQQVFYQLEPRQGSAKVKVPASQMASRGIRPLLSPQQIEGLLGPAEQSAGESQQETYSERVRRWKGLLRSGNETSSYDFLREWHGLAAQGVNFSPKESEMYQNVQRSLTQEVAQVLGLSTGRASARLTQGMEVMKATPQKRKNV